MLRTTGRSKQRSLPTTMPNQPSKVNSCCDWLVYCGDRNGLYDTQADHLNRLSAIQFSWPRSNLFMLI